jgi:hypothetical protein
MGVLNAPLEMVVVPPVRRYTPRLETISRDARESIAVAAIAGSRRPHRSNGFERPEPAFLGIGLAPFRAIASNHGDWMAGAPTGSVMSPVALPPRPSLTATVSVHTPVWPSAKTKVGLATVVELKLPLQVLLQA